MGTGCLWMEGSMKKIQRKILLNILGIDGITLWPNIYVNDVNDYRIVNHELIHICQIKSLIDSHGKTKGVWLFYWRYVKHLIIKGGYRKIPFEIEARKYQRDSRFLETIYSQYWDELKGFLPEKDRLIN